ncbi:unnamed protein product [Rotaria sordida]|uniref:Uncharacterized protein n=1 Tax=Rotaria sordida TaxID=392033 RepID=A0A815QMT8_9BILA|nr:unnamed protein product [Rotaria sordida]CAF1643422.1 unnamed protein product [Rotaria sordida]
MFKISKDAESSIYHFYTTVINSIHCDLTFSYSTRKWNTSNCRSTLMAGPPDVMKKETIVFNLISNIQEIDVKSVQLLIITTTSGEQVQFARY